MKKVFVLFTGIFLISHCSFSQLIERIAVKGANLTDFYDKEEYKYSKFLTAHVHLNNGDSAVGKFNFDFFDQSLRYINEKSDTVVLANTKDVTFATVGTDTFFYDNGFYEWMATSLNARLTVKHTYKLLERQNVGAYGLTSPTMGIKSIGRVFGSATSAELPPNEEVIFSRVTTYYISLLKNGMHNFVMVNKDNLSNLFPKKDVEDFIKENKLNLNKEEDLVDVFIYVSKPNNKSKS